MQLKSGSLIKFNNCSPIREAIRGVPARIVDVCYAYGRYGRVSTFDFTVFRAIRESGGISFRPGVVYTSISNAIELCTQEYVDNWILEQELTDAG